MLICIRLSLSLYIYIYMYMHIHTYIHTYIHIYIYIYIYIYRERESERDTHTHTCPRLLRPTPPLRASPNTGRSDPEDYLYRRTSTTSSTAERNPKDYLYRRTAEWPKGPCERPHAGRSDPSQPQAIKQHTTINNLFTLSTLRLSRGWVRKDRNLLTEIGCKGCTKTRTTILTTERNLKGRSRHVLTNT